MDLMRDGSVKAKVENTFAEDVESPEQVRGQVTARDSIFEFRRGQPLRQMIEHYPTRVFDFRHDTS